jgi:regulator of protease activity HflC (stomatin/prohibitin superfamily)
VFLVSYAAGALTENSQDVPVVRQRIRVVAAIAGGLAVLLFVFGGIKEVPTRAVGVPTAFGSVEASLRPGIHWKLPWTSVNILDETIQTTSYDGSNCLDVRIGGQQTACLDVTLQWRVLDSGASTLFNDYNGQGSSNKLGQQPSTSVPGGIMGTITDAVVIRELQQVVNEVLGDYNPIQDVATSATAGNSQFSGFGPVVLKDMQRDLAGRIQVLNAFLPLLRYDSATQTRLNQIQQQVGETAIANEEYATNQAQAKANGAIAASVSSNPSVLEYECLQLIQTAEKTGYTGLPPTLSCLGGSGSVVSVGK